MFLLKKNSNFFLNLKANFSRFEKRDEYYLPFDGIEDGFFLTETE